MVADAAVVETVAAGDGVPVAVLSAVEAVHVLVSVRVINRRGAHVPAVVVARPASTPSAQYASNTEMALVACVDHINESHDDEMADVITSLISELESVQKQV